MKKVVLVGSGARAHSHMLNLKRELPDVVSFEGVYDTNPIRAQFVCDDCNGKKVYSDFDLMLDEVHPDIVFICTKDVSHCEYAVKAMEKGYDVMLEKPMAINKEQCLTILEAERRTGKKVTVTFNCRFMPFFSAIKETIDSGIVGEILHVDLRWMLDRSHGADYFRRWHRKLHNSGGLLVHKATHHFDIVNWLIEKSPLEVSGFGSLQFYGKNGSFRGERCLNCPHKEDCPYYFDLSADATLEQLYLKAEGEDGYFRDRCIFDEEIDIYDTMAVNVKYESNITLSYSLVAYSPYEGWDLVITGTKGRLEASTSTLAKDDPYEHMVFYGDSGNKTEFHVKKKTGDHGGSDKIMRKMLFEGNMPDTMNRLATSLDGAESVLIGACANESIQTGKIISISEIIKDFK